MFCFLFLVWGFCVCVGVGILFFVLCVCVGVGILFFVWGEAGAFVCVCVFFIIINYKPKKNGKMQNQTCTQAC
jgi:hypothetical protein